MKINYDKHSLTQEQLMRVVTYCPDTGVMTRIKKIHPKTQREYECSSPVKGKNNRGYFWLNLFGRMYLVHRLAFLYMTGKHPENEIDHVNGDRSDNRWGNLRECSSEENSRNQGVRKDSTSGVRGVTYNTCKTWRTTKRWTARISHKGQRILLGNFSSFDDAVAARKRAEIEYGYHENHAKRE